VSLLFDRWPRLRALPKVPLVDGWTPLEPAARLSDALGAELWVKRDDRTAARYGGNKVRKLEHLLGAARAEGADTLVTIGAIGSHHVLATALFGREQGFAVHGVMAGQPASVHAEENARADLCAGAELHPVRAFALVPAAVAALMAKLRLTRKHPYLIPTGGSDRVGTRGYVEAGLELAQQLVTELPGKDPTAIYVALGSGGTAVGLAVGLAAAGVMVPIVAVRVTPRALLPRALLEALAHQVVDDLRATDDRFPQIADLAMANFSIDEDELGEGYAVPTLAATDAIRLARSEGALELDLTYTGKTFAALVKGARGAHRGKRLLYVHTLSSAPMEPLLSGAPPLPPALSRLLR
jgi:1-aminocyclopropane-1-carboxylate deaminase/D-cysteine desulfhydrase-like pyridoxal-dependent ACC family enzyme